MSYNEDNHHKSIIGSLISGLIAIVFWYYFIKILIKLLSFLFEIFIEISKFIIELSIKVTKYLYQLTTQYIQKRKLKSTYLDSNSLATTSPISSNDRLRNPFLSYKPNTKIDTPSTKKFDYSQSITDFRAKHPFVMVDVHPLKQTQFISECDWLQKKIGHFPSEADQQAILKSLGNVTE